MNTKTITLISTILLAVSSCLKIQDKEAINPSGSDCLWVDFGSADTRVYVDGVKTLLHSEDIFTVFHQSSINEQWIYVGEDGTTDGKLSLNAKDERTVEFTPIYSVYPWAETASVSEGIISTVLPDIQYFKKGSFGRGAAVLAAATTTNTLHFKYASGFVRLSLKGNAAIKEITLRSKDNEPIAGACTINMNGDRPVLVATGSASILMRNLDFSPMNVEGAEDFIFSLAPGTYKDGMSFQITYTTGQVQNITYTDELTVTAGHISTPIEATCQDLLTIEANFRTDGQNAINPFSTDITRDLIPGVSGSTSESDDVFLISDSAHKYPFRFYIGKKDEASNLRITRSGLNFGGCIGDYIKFPGIDGMVLTSVRVMADKECIVSICSQENIAVAGLVPTTITVNGAKPGEACKMIMCTNQISRFYNITLYYDSAL